MKRFLKISLTFCVITSFFFAGCKNFMNGNGVLQELNSAIDYANAESFTVLINSTDGSGSFLTGNGEKKLKVGDSVEVEFKVNDAWQFQKWIAVDKENQSKNLTNYIKFSDSTSTKTTITLLTECENILVMPKCVERLKIASYLPDTKNEVSYNTDIFITFNYNISQSSITYSTEELESLGIDDSYELIKITQPDNSEAVYGYKKNNVTYYKNIEITSSSGEKLNEYFNPPQLISGKTLLITKNDVPFIFDSTNKKSITVSVAPNFSEKSGISVGPKQASFSYTINDVSKIADPTVKIDFLANKEYGTITPNQTTECFLQKDYDISFTETKDYKFVRWEAVYNDGTNDSAEDMVLIKDKTAKNTTFQLKYAIPGLVIKAVCEKRPEVEGVFPPNLSLGTARNTNITITFSEPIQDLEPEFFNFDSEKCIISLKDTNGVELNKYYSTPFINYDKKTVIIPANSSNIIRASTKVVVSIDLSLFKNENGISVANEPSLYSWEFTTGNSIINTPPVIQYFRIAVSEENVHNTTNGKYFSPINGGYNIEVNPQNHAGKTVYGYINTYDNESKPKYLYITETLLQDVNGNSISSSDPYTEKQELKFESPLATDTYFSYTFNTSPERVDGLYKLEFYIEDDFEDSSKLQSEVITYYVVKDTICDGLKNLIINNNSSIIKYGNNNNETNVPNNTGMPIQYSSDNSGRKIRSYYYNLNDIGGGITDFEIKGFVDSNYFNDGTEKFKEEYIVEIYKGYARTEDATNTKIHYTYKDNKYIFSINENDIGTSKDLFIRVVFSDAVGNSETYYVAFPKIPDLNILKVTNKDNNDNLKFITPEIINYNTDSYADIKYRFFAKNSNNKDSNVISAHYYESNDGNHILYADANPVSAEDKFLLTITATDKYDLYIQPVYCYSYGNATIYGAPTKIPENGYQYSDSLNSELLEFDVETIDNKNGTCTLTVKLNSEKKEGVTYSVLCIAKNISQTVPLEKASFTFDCSEAFNVTIAIYMNDDSEPAAIKTVKVNIDCLPPRRKSTIFIELRGTDGYVCKVNTPLEDANGNLYDVNKTTFYQDLYYSEDGSNFKENGIKITVPVTVSSATEAVYEIDVRNLKYGVQSSNYYKASNYLYIETSDTKNNKYSGVFAGFNCQYCSRPVTLAYDGKTKELQVTTPNHPNYDNMVSQWGQTSAQQNLPQNNVQGYLEFFDSKTNKWIKPEKVKDSNNLKQFVNWDYSNKKWYNNGTPVYDLSDISNYKVIRLISWMSSPYLLPAYNFFGIQTPLKYGTILAGTKDAVLVRESNTEIPTLVYAKYSDFDYGLDINLWEIGGFETATQVVYDSTNLSVSNDSSKFNYVPSGKYYVFIARFADGTTSISNVFKK